MHFKQQVKLTKTHPLDVIKSFHDKGFIKYLTAAQPVRIDSWNGIDDDKEASFSFWFFGWRKIKVVHKNYSISDSRLYFEDLGTSLPFGLSKWKHQHIVEPYRKGSIIIDKVAIDSSSKIKKYLAFPIMIFPILLRRVTYKIWFNYLKDRTWVSMVSDE